MVVLGLLSLSHFKWSIKTLSPAYMMALSYFIWALLAQNVEKPRHIVPVVLFISIHSIRYDLKEAFSSHDSCHLFGLDFVQFGKIRSNDL